MKRNKKKNRAPKGYYKTFDVGNFIVDLFYDEDDFELCYAEIRSPQPCLETRLYSTHDGYGLLMSAAIEDDEASISAYCSLLAISATLLAVDSPFVEVVNNGFEDWTKRKMEEAREEAEKATSTDEEADKLLMEAAIEVADMPRNEQMAYMRNVIDRLSKKVEAAERTDVNENNDAYGEEKD